MAAFVATVKGLASEENISV